MELVLKPEAQLDVEQEIYPWSDWTESDMRRTFGDYESKEAQKECGKCKICNEVAIKVGSIIVYPCEGCAQKNGFVWGCAGYKCLGVNPDTKKPNDKHSLMYYLISNKIAISVKKIFKIYFELDRDTPYMYEHQLNEGDEIQVFSNSLNKFVTATLVLVEGQMMAQYLNYDLCKPAPIKYWRGIAPNIYDQNKKLSLKIKQDIYGYMRILHDEFFNRTPMFVPRGIFKDGIFVKCSDEQENEHCWKQWKEFLDEGPII